MRNNGDTVGVALVKEACPLCGALTDGPIIMNTRLTKHNADNVKAMHGQTIGYSDKPCKECRDIMSKAFLIIGVVEAKTDDYKNPYRSGNKWGVRKEAALEMFGEESYKKGVCFMDVHTADQIGLPNPNFNA